MSPEERVKLAREIAMELVGVTPSEWSKWVRYAAVKGLHQALRLCEHMERSPSVRPGPKHAYSTIHSTLSKRLDTLSSLPQPELLDLLGHVRWAFTRQPERVRHEEA